MAASRQNRVPDNTDVTNADWLVQLSIVAVVPVVNIPDLMQKHLRPVLAAAVPRPSYIDLIASS